MQPLLVRPSHHALAKRRFQPYVIPQSEPEPPPPAPTEIPTPEAIEAPPHNVALPASQPPAFLITPESAVASESKFVGAAADRFAPRTAPAEHDFPSFKFKAEGTSREDKSKYAHALVDQAVGLLDDVWQPYFPSACGARVAEPASPPPSSLPPKSRQRAVRKTMSSHLPTPSTPSMPIPQMSPPPNPTVTHPYQATAEHMPLRQFIEEVLRRSRTTCSILQAALCYIEAIKSKLGSIAKKEEERLLMEANLRRAMAANPSPPASGISDLTLVDDMTVDGDDSPVSCIMAEDSDYVPAYTPPDVQMPSPLLCPRRTFLAALLLASKFLHDRAYSNKAWSKVSGLPAKEIGRCERALGEALDWRLWVGKGVNASLPGLTVVLGKGFDEPMTDNNDTVDASNISLATIPHRLPTDDDEGGVTPKLDPAQSRSVTRSKSDGELMVKSSLDSDIALQTLATPVFTMRDLPKIPFVASADDAPRAQQEDSDQATPVGLPWIHDPQLVSSLPFVLPSDSRMPPIACAALPASLPTESNWTPTACNIPSDEVPDADMLCDQESVHPMRVYTPLTYPMGSEHLVLGMISRGGAFPTSPPLGHPALRLKRDIPRPRSSFSQHRQSLVNRLRLPQTSPVAVSLHQSKKGPAVPCKTALTSPSLLPHYGPASWHDAMHRPNQSATDKWPTFDSMTTTQHASPHSGIRLVAPSPRLAANTALPCLFDLEVDFAQRASKLNLFRVEDVIGCS